MSRNELRECAKSLHIPIIVRRDGKQGVKDNNWLRTDIIERTYGPGLSWRFKSAAEADRTMQIAAACYHGELGVPLEKAQSALRNAMTEMVDLRRLRTLKRRKWAEEARLSRSIRVWLDLCDAAQRLHEVEAGMRADGYDLAPVEADTTALAWEQYQKHMEVTAPIRDSLTKHLRSTNAT